MKETDNTDWVENIRDPNESGPGRDTPSKNKQQRIREMKDDLSADHDIIVISDNDLDGISCFTVFEKAFQYDNGDRSVARIKSGHRNYTLDLDEALELVLETNNSQPLYITDIRIQDIDTIKPLLEEYDGEVHVFDHHEWSEEDKAELSEVANLDIRSEGENCAAEIAYDNVDFESENMDDFVDVVRDHDAWIKEDPRSDVLSDFLFNFADEVYIETTKEHGASVTEDEEVGDIIEEMQYRKTRRIEAQVKTARWYNITENKVTRIDSKAKAEGDGVKVAVAFGNAYRSKVGEVLYKGLSWDEKLDLEWQNEFMQDGDADIAIIQKPGKNKISIRTNEDWPIANKIAERLGGGGHEKAAGAGGLDILKPSRNFELYQENNGQIADTVILPNIQSAVQEEKKQKVEQ